MVSFRKIKLLTFMISKQQRYSIVIFIICSLLSLGCLMHQYDKYKRLNSENMGYMENMEIWKIWKV